MMENNVDIMVEDPYRGLWVPFIGMIIEEVGSKS